MDRPPLLFTGISVRSFDLNKGDILVRLKSSFWNRNYFGTHFGGSLCTLCDPFFAFILIHHLGREFIVWDKAVKIEFIRATHKPVFVRFSISQEKALEIQRLALKERKVEPIFYANIVDSEGSLIAKCEKTLYVKKKPSSLSN